MAMGNESTLTTDIRDSVVAACERVDALVARMKGPNPVDLAELPKYVDATRFLAEAFRLLAPEWFSPKVDARQQGLFVPPDAARPR